MSALPTGFFEPPLNRSHPWLEKLPSHYRDILRQGRSVPINLGNASEELFRCLARFTFGDDAVPRFIRGQTVPVDEFDEFVSCPKLKKSKSKKQYIITNVKVDYGSLLNFVEERAELGQPICESDLPQIVKKFSSVNGHLYKRPVDVAILCDALSLLSELKSSADTDTGKTPSVVIKDLLGPWLCYGDLSAKLRYGIFYNNSKPGEDRWASEQHSFFRFFDRPFALVEQSIWSVVVPTSISYDHFVELCQNRIVYLQKNR